MSGTATKKRKIIYISRNMRAYRSAMYQQDVMDEIGRQAQVFFYGPGFPLYSRDDDISEVVAKSGMNPDFVVLGHAWLADSDDEPIDPHIKLNLDRTSLPKVGIINKEYVNLDKKLDYYRKYHFDLVFSHHHKVDDYSKKTGVKFVFWPFGVNHHVFNTSRDEMKKCDVAFSGILQNKYRHSQQSDIRAKIQSEIFYCVRDIAIWKKKPYGPYSVFWNALPRWKSMIYVALITGKYRHLPLKEYSRLQKETKIFVNTLSPLGLVSTRFYENMASNCLVLCEESEIYPLIFKEKCYVEYRPDLSDFREKISYCLKNDAKRQEITTRAYEEVMARHTWEKRVRDFLQIVEASVLS